MIRRYLYYLFCLLCVCVCVWCLCLHTVSSYIQGFSCSVIKKDIFYLLLIVMNGKELSCQCRRHKRHRFDPWVGRIPLEKGMATHTSILAWTILWTEEPLVGYSPQGHKESDRTKATQHAHNMNQRKLFSLLPKCPTIIFLSVEIYNILQTFIFLIRTECFISDTHSF